MTQAEAADEPTMVQARLAPGKVAARPGLPDSPADFDAPYLEAPGAAELVSMATLDDADGARAWFNGRLSAFSAALSHDQAGRLRSPVERQALGDAARDMIERLVSRTPGASVAADWPTDATLQPGQLLANTFYVRALIARGGVGEIYRVRHRDLRTEHAIKILQPQHTLNPILVGMLLDEGRCLLRLRQAGVVAGHGLIRDADGRLLMVMEFVRGSTLAARLRDGPLAAAELSALATALLQTLTGLHAEGIVHGDLSPDNIMLESDSCSDPKIIDFGLAQRVGEAEDTAALVDFAGKFSWVSPEQLLGSPHALDDRSDLYSLGLVLAAASRGRRLDMGSDHASATAARAETPALEGVPLPWAGLIRSLLQPRPEDRPANAAAALAELAGKAPQPPWYRRLTGRSR